MRSTLILLVVAAAAVAGPKPGDTGTPEHQKAAELVGQLGHARFAVREAAARQLLEMGAAAVPALTEGTKAADEEVRSRAIALLPQAKAADWKRRADAYLADAAGKQKHDLPLLAEFEKRIGKPDAGSRKLFADMVRTNGELLEKAASGQAAGADAVKARSRVVLSQVETGGKQVKAQIGDLAALFFAHTLVGRDRADFRGGDHPAHLLANPGLSDGIAATEVGPAFRRIVVQWAESRPADDITSHQFIALAVRNKPFREAVPVLAKLAKDKNASVINVRALSVEALGKVGDADAKAALEGLIEDKTSLLGGFNGEEMRLGDLAFASLLTAEKKKPTDYGVSSGIGIAFRFAARGEVVQLMLQAFPSDTARQAGLKKWREERGKK
jgi:hypothetical protein